MSSINTKITSFIAVSDIVSLLNMSSGFLAIISSINNNLELAAILMIIAIIFDSIDGWVARKTNRQDDLGFGKTLIPCQTLFHLELHRLYLYIAALTPPRHHPNNSNTSKLIHCYMWSVKINKI